MPSSPDQALKLVFSDSSRFTSLFFLWRDGALFTSQAKSQGAGSSIRQPVLPRLPLFLSPSIPHSAGRPSPSAPVESSCLRALQICTWHSLFHIMARLGNRMTEARSKMDAVIFFSFQVEKESENHMDTGLFFILFICWTCFSMDINKVSSLSVSCGILSCLLSLY